MTNSKSLAAVRSVRSSATELGSSTVTLSGSGSLLAGLSVGGTLIVSGGTLSVGNSAGSQNFNLDGNGSLAGAGTITVSGTTSISGSPTISGGLTLSGSGAGGSLTASTLTIGAGGATFNFASGALQWTSGTLAGTGTLTVANGSFLTLNPGGATLTVSTAVNNLGSTSFTSSGLVSLSSGVTFTNAGLFDIQNGSGTIVSGGTFNNTGTLQKDTNAGNEIIASQFSNQGGTVNVSSGVLQLTGGGTFAGGTYNVGSSSAPSWSFSGNDTWSGTLTGSGAGQRRVGRRHDHRGRGRRDAEFPDVRLLFLGGRQRDPCRNRHADRRQQLVSDARLGRRYPDGIHRREQPGHHNAYFRQRSFRSSAGAPFTNAGTFDIQNGSGTVISGAGAFSNTGILKKDTNAGDVTLASSFTNTGTVNLIDGILRPSSATQVSGSTLTGGSWLVSGGSDLVLNGDAAINTIGSTASVTVSGSGSRFANINQNNLTTDNGTFIVTGGNAFSAASSAFSDSGTLTVGSGSNFTASGGLTIQSGALLDGSGTITVNSSTVTNSGTVNPGTVGGAGTLTITGNYRQMGSGTITLDIGGTTAGTYDLLAVSGNASLAGTLNADTINGFSPSTGNSFSLLTYGSHSGTFSTLNYNLGSNGFLPAYGSTSFTLAAVPTGTTIFWTAGTGTT